ncbi:MAG: NADH-quinone oxidoreductase subunit, partial [Actinomycetota bacterium]|nr:NADH-quinone oxidoreductase subunit [Actinomycetota bacterium]
MYGDVVVRVRPDAWRRSAQFCKEQLGCDYLSFVSAIDWMPAPALVDEGSGDTSTPAQPKEMTYGVAGAAGRFQLFAMVASTLGAHQRVILKTDVDESDPHAESWVSVYPGADWHERETWEMFGIVFDGHPALRHLYLPFEFEGHPLRKDYPLLAREVKPWPGLVDVEPMPGEDPADEDAAPAVEAS